MRTNRKPHRFTFDWKSFSLVASDLDDLLLSTMNADDYPDVHCACSCWIRTPFPILLLLSDRYHWSNDVDDFRCSNVFSQVDVLLSLFRRVSFVSSIELEPSAKNPKENYCIDSNSFA